MCYRRARVGFWDIFDYHYDKETPKKYWHLFRPYMHLLLTSEDGLRRRAKLSRSLLSAACARFIEQRCRCSCGKPPKRGRHNLLILAQSWQPCAEGHDDRAGGSKGCGSFRKLAVPCFGVLIIRILLFRVLYWGPLFSETPMSLRPELVAHGCNNLLQLGALLVCLSLGSQRP